MYHPRRLTALLVLLFLSALPLQPVAETPEFRLCASGTSEIVANPNSDALGKYRPSLSELTHFIESVDRSPTLHEITTFLDDFSRSSLRRAERNRGNTSHVMSIAYRFRLAISVIQLDYCIHPSFLMAYDSFLNGLRDIDFALNFEPKTLEGFIFRHERGVASISQKDVSFISAHLIDTPINAIVRDRLLALSRDPRINGKRLAQLCNSMSALGFPSEVISDTRQLTLEKIGCIEIDKSIGAAIIDVDRTPSNFLVIATDGGDLSVTTNIKYLPAFDLSSKLDQDIFPALESSSTNSVTIPLAVFISPENSDGSTRQYQGIFDGIVTIIHLFLVHPSDGIRDERVASPAKSGGNLTINSASFNLLESAIAYTSEGQLGASFLPSKGSPEVITEVDRQTFNTFVFNSSALNKIQGSYLPIVNPNSRDMEDLLFVDTRFGRRSLDVHIDVPLEWLQFVKSDQRAKLKEVCGGEIAQCISSRLEEQVAQISREILRSCDGVCDMRALGIGLASRQPTGSDGPLRLEAPKGAPGKFTLLYD